MNHNAELKKAQENYASSQWDKAESKCRHILEEEPTHLVALQLLARIQATRGNLHAATQTVEEALQSWPEDDNLHRQCGDLYFKAGNLDRAIKSYRRANEIAPNDPEISNNLAVALRNSGALDEAVVVLVKVIRKHPDLSLPLLNLGDTLRLQGELSLAIEKYRAVVRINPKDAAAYNSMGITLSMQGRVEEAISNFEDALKLNPQFPEVENNLANTLSSARRYEEAIDHATNAIRLRPDFPNAHLTLGNIYRLQGNNALAIFHYKKAIGLDPRNAITHQSLGSTFTDTGQFAEAIEHLEEALQLNPNLFVVYQNLMALAVQEKYSFSDRQIDRIHQLVKEKKLSNADASRLNFTLGSLLDKKGEYDAAMRCFQTANNLQERILTAQRHVFTSQEHTDSVDKIIGSFDSALMAGGLSSNLTTERPVFVIGMPRSGTTLVEQIIASHPQAAGVGELSEVAHLTGALSVMLQKDYPICMSRARSEQLFDLACQYEKRVSQLGADSLRVVDKMPDNFLHLGFIAMLFPNAHIVHCKRHPLDICLSCYKSDFGGVRWAGNLENIGLYFAQYHRLMKHWYRVLPLKIHDVVYEDLVTNHKATAQKLIAACELHWDDACLDFYKGNRAVQTLSRVQVRQPIYRSSVGRWRHYEKHLDSLRTMLETDLGTDFP